jgi:hypothetical protein
MINNDTPEETNDFKDLKIAGHFSSATIKHGPSKFLITRLVSYSLALQVINTPKAGIFYYILN